MRFYALHSGRCLKNIVHPAVHHICVNKSEVLKQRFSKVLSLDPPSDSTGGSQGRLGRGWIGGARVKHAKIRSRTTTGGEIRSCWNLFLPQNSLEMLAKKWVINITLQKYASSYILNVMVCQIRDKIREFLKILNTTSIKKIHANK